MKIFYTGCLLLFSAIATAQLKSLTLDSCYYLARQKIIL